MEPSGVARLLRQIRVLRAPAKALSTFGATNVEYRLISSVEGLSDRTRLREGRVVSERPKILTAEAFKERFDGFGPDAAEFARWLTSRYGDLLRSLEYNFKNQGFKARVISEPPAQVAERVLGDEQARDQAVIRCPDACWSLAIMKFTLDEAARSFPTNVRDLDRRGLFGS